MFWYLYNFLKIYHMRIIFAFVLSCFCSFSYAQSLEYEYAAGSGITYMVENADKTIDISYHAPVTIATGLKYTPQNSHFGVLLRYQYTNTNVDGQKWFDTFQFFDAIVDDNSLFLMLEYLRENDKKLNVGANFGFGFTKQFIKFTSENYSMENYYPSLNFSAIAAYYINSRLSIRLQPGVQFSDPINGLKIKPYNFAKEDIHFLTLLGISLKLL